MANINKLFQDMEKTEYVFGNGRYKVNLREFFERCRQCFYEAVEKNVMTRIRPAYAASFECYPFSQNDIFSLYGDRDNYSGFLSIIMMALTVETEKFSEKYHSSKSTSEKENIYREAISYYMDGIQDKGGNRGEFEKLVACLARKEMNFKDIWKIESFFSSVGEDYAVLFMSLKSAFIMAKMSFNEKYQIHYPSYSAQKRNDIHNESSPDWGLISAICKIKMKKFFDAYDNVFFKEDKGQFSANFVLVNKAYEDAVKESTTSTDIGVSTPYQGVESSLFGGYTGYGFQKRKMGRKKIMDDKISKKKIDLTWYSRRYPKPSSTYFQDSET